MAGARKEKESAGDLYFRMVTSYGYRGQMSFNPEFFFLMPAGRVYRGVPPQGLDAFDYNAVSTQDPKNIGTYAIEGGKMKVQWVSGEVQEYTYEKGDGDTFTLDGIFTQKVQAFPKGHRLSGTWTYLLASGGGGQGVSSSQTLELDPNGTFKESRMATLSVETSGQSISGTSGNGGEGTYDLSGNTLTLRYTGGGERRFSAFPFGENMEGPSPEFLNVNGKMFGLES